MVMNDGNSEEGMGWDEADEISGAVYSVGEGVQDYSEGGGLCWRWLGWCLKKFQSEKWSILLRSMAVAGRANCLCHLPSGSGKNNAGDTGDGDASTISPQFQHSGLLHPGDPRGECDGQIRGGHHMDGRCGRLASTIVSSAESHRWPNVGKYRMDLTSFESLALPELQFKENIDLFIIDEVGKMELYSSSFFHAVKRVCESNITILASIHIPKYGRDILAIAHLRDNPGTEVFSLDRGSRDSIKEHVYALLLNLLQKH